MQDGIELRLCHMTDAAGERILAFPAPLEFTAISQSMAQSATPSPPLVTLQDDEAQELMDELWRAGIRPSEGSGSAGQMAAVQAHLQDMRSLVFKPTP